MLFVAHFITMKMLVYRTPLQSDAHCAKRVLMPYANSENSDQSANPSSLIRAFSVRLYILQFTVILQTGSERERPDQAPRL